ncbi:aminotransferase class I/II-fold pyridoxal phosphate-dependent enzyme [Spirochaeta isovalerica]|uniref:Aspartate/methionine/tyrosine aminotransferase n=1 Tax=Spirochaeta isovalerica TaxID=150 RepID=A0A841RGD0_9SPIO|nr:aminotransferase class I/II-fold pyridoxal phosphate-dependent enzyme [Spirochaeta isovalerica]MBB6482636.1 aspartate/methionine/tyrosine aminotransferase [Spirochaeta isovalerica]
MNPQAEILNRAISEANPVVLELLSRRGKNIFFPSKGLIRQGLDASTKKINASIGIAMEDDGSPLRLNAIDSKLNMPPEETFPYASSYGKAELREIWHNIIREKNPSLGNHPITKPVVTHALTHGLSMSGYLFVDEGDEIIMPDLFWGNYKLLFENAYGGVLSFFPLFEGSGFNTAGLESKLNGPGEKKILLLNFPNNPTGYTPTEEEVAKIVAIINRAAESGKKIILITDDAYFGLVYEPGVYRESIFAPVAALHENVLAVKVDGATKEDYAWGFRVGFITFSNKLMNEGMAKALEDKAAGAVRGNVSNCAHLSQSLLHVAYKSPDYKEDKIRKFELLKKRYTKVKEVLEAKYTTSDLFKIVPNNSGYFMCLKLKGIDAEEVRQQLLNHYDTGVMAIGDMIRVAYSSLPTDQIELLFDNINNACKDVKKIG